jgi:hypothetical protein
MTSHKTTAGSIPACSRPPKKEWLGREGVIVLRPKTGGDSYLFTESIILGFAGVRVGDPICADVDVCRASVCAWAAVGGTLCDNRVEEFSDAVELKRQCPQK